MSNLTDALAEWVKHQPQDGKSCCWAARGHTFIDPEDKRERLIPDELLNCPRELAWRKYVRIRDEDNDWHPSIRSTNPYVHASSWKQSMRTGKSK